MHKIEVSCLIHTAMDDDMDLYAFQLCASGMTHLHDNVQATYLDGFQWLWFGRSSKIQTFVACKNSFKTFVRIMARLLESWLGY